MESPGKRFREALAQEKPLQIIGTINAYVSLMAEKIGYRAIYLSGGGIANMSYGLPDLGMTTLDNVLEDVRRLSATTPLPILVDGDTGWGSAFMLEKTVREMIRAGAAAVHIEDQVFHKRCGHRPGKALVSCEEMCDRMRAAAQAKTDPDFVIMARTDAIAGEGLDAAIERAQAYVEAGADMIFAEAVTELPQYRAFREALGVPILANITEFGKTPLYSCKELGEAGVDMVLYPLTATRAMNLAAEIVMKGVREKGCQEDFVDQMQTRANLYEYLDYHKYEEKMNQLINKEGAE